mmetsp:Transcript_4947/g.13607  ORF Transcript_4947/g.13607 Transcript_4947/m.13607 type:complete len:215 (+) Transcript_4947:641-1285(+)
MVAASVSGSAASGPSTDFFAGGARATIWTTSCAATEALALPGPSPGLAHSRRWRSRLTRTWRLCGMPLRPCFVTETPVRSSVRRAEVCAALRSPRRSASSASLRAMAASKLRLSASISSRALRRSSALRLSAPSREEMVASCSASVARRRCAARWRCSSYRWASACFSPASMSSWSLSSSRSSSSLAFSLASACSCASRSATKVRSCAARSLSA